MIDALALDELRVPMRSRTQNSYPPQRELGRVQSAINQSINLRRP